MKHRHPKVAICFHDAAPSGASVWLKNFILRSSFDTTRTFPVLPGASVMEKEMCEAGFPVYTVNMTSGDISKSSLFKLPGMAWNRIKGVLDYVRLFRRLRPSVVYVNSSYQIAPTLAAWLLGLPVLIHVREGWRSGRTHGLKAFVVQHLAQSVAFDASVGMELFGPQKSGTVWEVSPNGVPTSLSTVRQQHAERRERLGLDKDEKAFLFLGSLGERKGLHDLLAIWPRVMEKFPTARLYVGGPVIPTETNKAILDFPANPPKGTAYLGFVDRIEDWLGAADFFILPSYAEAMPISISEAMMAGLPVIARDVADVSFQIGEGRGYLFEGEGSQVVLDAVYTALSDDEDASKRAQLAQVFAKNRLAERMQQKQILRLMKQAIRIKRRRR